jgi:hypothetical protein
MGFPSIKFKKGNYGLDYYSFDIGKCKKGKNMDVILQEQELLKAVEEYLKPKMSHHNISKVFVREVKVDNKKKLEVIARLEERESKL